MKRSSEKLLEVKNLEIGFENGSEAVPVIKGISFELAKGESLGIVGESGSGKSITSLAIMGLLPKGAKIFKGSVLFSTEESGPEDLVLLSEADKRAIRGKDIAMVFQEPMTALNPLEKCGAQVQEAIEVHKRLSKGEAKREVLELFKSVDLPNPERVFDSYPHEISGGQKQRVMIAMALSCDPSLIIADEPTTALDVTVQNKVLSILRQLCITRNTALIFITHDLGVVAKITDRVLVMNKGQILEEGFTKDVFLNPSHAYTRDLINCRPRKGFNPRRLPIVGAPNDISELKSVVEEELGKKLMQVKDVSIAFPMSYNWLGKPLSFYRALKDVSFDLYNGETLGLVGESGCGKTTLGRALLKLQEIDSGKIIFDGKEIQGINQAQFRPFRKEMQIIFQDPYGSLNPRLTVGNAILEPMLFHRIYKQRSDAKNAVKDLLEKVGLTGSAYSKYPHEFSGGQRQRVCIARALSVQPKFIVCDESVSALDVSVQAMVLNLLNDLKDEFGLTYIFISHDLSVVQYMSDRVMVMKSGEIVEMGTPKAIYENHQTEYTAKLIESIPEI